MNVVGKSRKRKKERDPGFLNKLEVGSEGGREREEGQREASDIHTAERRKALEGNKPFHPHCCSY